MFPNTHDLSLVRTILGGKMVLNTKKVASQLVPALSRKRALALTYLNGNNWVRNRLSQWAFCMATSGPIPDCLFQMLIQLKAV